MGEVQQQARRSKSRVVWRRIMRSSVSWSSIAAWLLVFTMGATVSSAPFREDMNPIAFAMVLFTYTPTNLAMLGCFAATSGSGGINEADAEDHRNAAVRGFFVYLMLISGMLVVSDDPFTSPSQSQYIRLAGMTSLLCFIVGWRPEVVASMMNRVLTAQGDGA